MGPLGRVRFLLPRTPIQREDGSMGVRSPVPDEVGFR